MALHLTDSVGSLPGIGDKARRDLKNSGVVSIGDLLYYLPFRYDDFSKTKPISELRAGDTVTLDGVIKNIESRRSWKNKKLSLTEAVFENKTGAIKLTWFNQPYLEQTLKPGTKVSIAGTVEDRSGLTLTNPIHEPAGKQIHTGRIVPVYGLSGSLKMRRLREAIKSALRVADEIEEWLPKEVLGEQGFPSLQKAIAEIHFPKSIKKLEEAVSRLKFDELFLHQLLFARVRDDRVKRTSYQIPINEEALKTFVSSFPFELTPAQKKAAWEIVQDMEHEHPMNRLLEGDVGSGKTAVAAVAINHCVQNTKTAVYLAPTEILAAQQHAGLQGFLKGYEVALLTRGQHKLGAKEVSKQEVIDVINAGEVQCIVGTHALLQETISLTNLALVVIDEQHRFGVEQRHALLDTGDKPAPHLLSMTATPIPRSLALTVYGDLELSIINQLPKGRKPIATALVPKAQQEGMWKHVKGMIQAGDQVFVVCPLIDPSDKLGVKSVTEIATELKKGVVGAARVQILHGKLKTDEKATIIRDFRDKRIDILVSTTVVEVGVDVPNATVMVITGAERFGLAQLHQLRGRVGRGEKQSYCYLLAEHLSDVSRQRLQAMVESTDGFALAEKDLELRGPGNIFGNAQSGFPDFKLATIADVELMKIAGDAAKRIVTQDPGLLEHLDLKKKVDQTFESVHLE
jgi:ATP-dependent DNA helicase RecG